jgi:hypothetical protein
MIGRRLRKEMILLLVLLWPMPSRAASSERDKPPAAIPAQTAKGSAAPKPHTVSTGRQSTKPQLSSEDRKVVKMMDLLEKMEMLQDMDLVAATEDKR